MPQGLAALMRAKYPGAYDDMSDADLESAVVAKYPEYQDLATKREPVAPKSFEERTQARLAKTFIQQDEQAKNVEKLTRNPSAMASMAASELTGGMSMLPRVLAQGGAAVLSGGLATKAQGGSNDEAVANTLGDALTNVGPMAVGAGLRTVAKPLMRSALRISAPIARKFGDIVPTALAERIMPTAKGAAKAEALREAGSAEKEQLLRSSPATIDPNDIATAARARIQPHLAEAFDAGETATTQAPKLINAVGRKAPMDLQRLDRAKSKWDDKIKNAIVARKFAGTVPDIAERTRQALASETRDALERAAPGYKDINRRIMTAEGIRQAAANRNAIPATGLADHLLAFSGVSPEHVAARLAMSPVVKGGAAIGANELGKLMMKPGAAPTAEMIRAAILQLLQQKQ